MGGFGDDGDEAREGRRRMNEEEKVMGNTVGSDLAVLGSMFTMPDVEALS